MSQFFPSVSSFDTHDAILCFGLKWTVVTEQSSLAELEESRIIFTLKDSISGAIFKFFNILLIRHVSTVTQS